MLERLLKVLKLTESIVAMAAYAAVAMLLMADVIGRELLGKSIFGAQQIAVYGAIIAGFLGLTLATSDNAHLRPGFMDFVFKRFEAQVVRIGDAVSGVFFLGGAYIAWTFVAVSMEFSDRAPVLQFVVWPLQLVIPYAFISAGMKHLVFAVRPDLKPAVSAETG